MRVCGVYVRFRALGGHVACKGGRTRGRSSSNSSRQYGVALRAQFYGDKCRVMESTRDSIASENGDGRGRSRGYETVASNISSYPIFMSPYQSHVSL